MANYENGLDTRKNILQTCNHLFYEKGFDKTTFKDISLSANVNQGLIVYYFKNKNTIARTIFQEMMGDMLQKIKEIFWEYDDLTRSFISDFLYFRLIFADEKFRAFMKLCCSNGILKKESSNMEERYSLVYHNLIHYLEESYINDVTLQEGLIAVYEGAKDNYTVYTCDHTEELSVDIATTNYITIYCRMMDIPRSTYGSKMMDAAVLSNQVQVQVMDFHFTMEKIH